MRYRWFAVALCAVLVLAGVRAPLAGAENVQVSAGVGATTLRVSGWTAPFAFVTLMENSVVVGTTTAGADGRYVLLLVGQMPGIHNFRIFSRDSKGRVTDPVTTQLNITEHYETAVSIFLPPTATTTDQGDSVVVEGSTAPDAIVILTIGGKYFKTKADGNGNWRYVIAASDLPASEYHISVAAILPGGLQSYVAGIPSVFIPPLASRQKKPVPGIFPGPALPGIPVLPSVDGTPAPNQRQPRHPGEAGQPSAPTREYVPQTDSVVFSLLPAVVFVLLLTILGWLLAARRRGESDEK